MHTGREGTDAMPYFDTFDLETIDILLISQYVHLFPLFHGASAMKTSKIGLLRLCVGMNVKPRSAPELLRLHMLQKNSSGCSRNNISPTNLYY